MSDKTNTALVQELEKELELRQDTMDHLLNCAKFQKKKIRLIEKTLAEVKAEGQIAMTLGDKDDENKGGSKPARPKTGNAAGTPAS